jgi:arginine-tRNA-protein transferase
MDRTCCPQYTIRLEAAQFAPSREHRRLQRRLSAFLAGELDLRGLAALAAADGDAGEPGGERAPPRVRAALSRAQMDAGGSAGEAAAAAAQPKGEAAAPHAALAAALAAAVASAVHACVDAGTLPPVRPLRKPPAHVPSR